MSQEDTKIEKPIIGSENYHFRTRVDGKPQHAFENNPYPLASDNLEINRLNEQQIIFRECLGGNVFAPISSNPTLIMDVGTGSGAWAIEVAEEYPKAKVIGLDLAPVQPTLVPKNCEFMVGDLTTDLETKFDPNTFDLIQSRVIHCGLKKTKWDKYVQDAYHLLKPGIGWLQIIESSTVTWDADAVPSASLCAKFFQLHQAGHDRRGTIPGGEHLEERFIKAGFVDINVRIIKHIMGDWAGDPKTAKLRRAHGRGLINAIPDIAMQHFQEAFPDPDERREFGIKARDECLERDYHFHSIMYIVTGKKPENT